MNMEPAYRPFTYHYHRRSCNSGDVQLLPSGGILFWPAALPLAESIISLLSLGIAWRESPVQATLLIRVDTYALFSMALLLSTGLAVLGFCYDYFKDREGENEELVIADCSPHCWAVRCWSVAATLHHFLLVWKYSASPCLC